MIITSKQWMVKETINFRRGESYTQKTVVTRWYLLGLPIYTRRTIHSANI